MQSIMVRACEGPELFHPSWAKVPTPVGVRIQSKDVTAPYRIQPLELHIKQAGKREGSKNSKTKSHCTCTRKLSSTESLACPCRMRYSKYCTYMVRWTLLSHQDVCTIRSYGTIRRVTLPVVVPRLLQDDRWMVNLNREDKEAGIQFPRLRVPSSRRKFSYSLLQYESSFFPTSAGQRHHSPG